VTKYLKEKQYYYDEYDRITIEQCKDHLERLAGNPNPKKKLTENQKTILKWLSVLAELHIYFIKGERYRNREHVVEEQLRSDARKDNTLERISIPLGIRCKHCNERMEFTQKDLDVYDETKVLIMFNCPKCGKGRAFYNNGEEWKYKPPNCSKCGFQYNSTNDRVENKIITTFTCPKCSNKEEMVLDLDEKYVPAPVETITDEDRQKYLMNSVEGAAYIDSYYKFTDASDALKDEQEREEHKELYDKVAKISRLRIAEVEKLLLDVATKNDYAKFQFGKPEISRYFIVEFSAEDIKPSREEYESKHNLQKACEHALKDTNWRVMSDGVSYRSGYLTGRVRCYEKDEDIVALIRN
jgi:transcription elongation factor Elf1